MNSVISALDSAIEILESADGGETSFRIGLRTIVYASFWGGFLLGVAGVVLAVGLRDLAQRGWLP